LIAVPKNSCSKKIAFPKIAVLKRALLKTAVLKQSFTPCPGRKVTASLQPVQVFMGGWPGHMTKCDRVDRQATSPPLFPRLRKPLLGGRKAVLLKGLAKMW